MLSLEKAIALGATHRATNSPYVKFYYRKVDGNWQCTDDGFWHNRTYANDGPHACAAIGIEAISLEVLMDEFIEKEKNNGK